MSPASVLLLNSPDVVLIGHSRVVEIRDGKGDGRPEEGARAVRAGESAPSQALPWRIHDGVAVTFPEETLPPVTLLNVSISSVGDPQLPAR
jgi:hypothetical protein